ncbi:MDR family MFS transporter [Bacillus haynesii]|uniref:MDR family MFS transporter n=1 Tax=Bacillus haynesii TaxID=1925021 RepID=UPI00227F51B3|nr:MDR family MFS transporter [Bacillus haynesii]MCY9433434.1 DHA2 family efflux MFS transporter permease subunit [Bacillus haynesii]
MSDTQHKTNQLPIVAVLIMGTFIAILNQTLLTTALPPIMRDLNITPGLAQWLTTVFMLVNGIMIPVTAFLIEKFTTRKLFMAAMSLFTAGTLICALSFSFPALIAGRVVQAAGAGIMMPLMQTVLLLIFPKEKRGSAMGMVGLVIAFAPAVGPTLSGWIVDRYPWEVLFYLLLPFAVIDMIAAHFILKNVTEQTSPKMDVTSIILSSLGFGGILYGFSSAGVAGWTGADVLAGFAVGSVALFWFIWRQLHLEEPILEFRVFKYPMFTLATIIGMVVFMSMIGAATIVPMYMQDMRHFTAMESGMMLFPGAVVMGLMSPITGRIFDKIGARILSITGLTAIFVTTLLLTHLTKTTPFAYLSTVYAIRMVGMGMVLMPVTTAGLNQLPRHLIPHGTAMNNTMRQMSGSIGTAVLITIMTQRALTDPAGPSSDTAMIHGVNLAFMTAAALSGIGLVLSFFIKQHRRGRLDGSRRKQAKGRLAIHEK